MGRFGSGDGLSGEVGLLPQRHPASTDVRLLPPAVERIQQPFPLPQPGAIVETAQIIDQQAQIVPTRRQREGHRQRWSLRVDAERPGIGPIDKEMPSITQPGRGQGHFLLGALDLRSIPAVAQITAHFFKGQRSFDGLPPLLSGQFGHGQRFPRPQRRWLRCRGCDRGRKATARPVAAEPVAGRDTPRINLGGDFALLDVVILEIVRPDEEPPLAEGPAAFSPGLGQEEDVERGGGRLGIGGLGDWEIGRLVSDLDKGRPVGEPVTEVEVIVRDGGLRPVGVDQVPAGAAEG